MQRHVFVHLLFSSVTKSHPFLSQPGGAIAEMVWREVSNKVFVLGIGFRRPDKWTKMIGQNKLLYGTSFSLSST